MNEFKNHTKFTINSNKNFFQSRYIPSCANNRHGKSATYLPTTERFIIIILKHYILPTYIEKYEL